MQTNFDGLLLNNKIYPIDDLKDLCEGMIDDQRVAKWERSVYKFILEWINDKDYIIQNTSGTTGKQKKLQLSKESMIHSARNTCKFFKLKFGQNALLCLPMDYIAGKMMIVRAFVGGFNLILAEPTSMPDFGGLKEIDFCAMVPLQVYNSLNSVETLRRIKKLIIGGAEIRDELEVMLRDLTIEVYATYGMAETCSHVAIRRLSGTEHEKYYKAIPNVKFTVDDRDCLIIEADYLKEKVVTNDVVDLIDSEKFRWIGRFDNLINSGGIKIIPEEVEAVISKSTGMDCAVIGLPDKKLGQKVVLIMEKGGSEVTKAEINTMIENDLPKYSQPKEIVYVDELPRNHAFKVDRNKLLKQIQE